MPEWQAVKVTFFVPCIVLNVLSRILLVMEFWSSICVFLPLSWRVGQVVYLGERNFPFSQFTWKIFKNMIYLTSILDVILREEAEEMPVVIKSMFYFIL